MVHSCCVNGCRARSHNYKRQKLDNNIRFFKFPSWKRGFGNKIGELTKRRRMAWVAAVGRKDITFKTAPSHMRVCSLHFHKGQPAYEMMETDPDWAPSLHMGHNSVRPTDTSRAARRMARLQLRQETSDSYGALDQTDAATTSDTTSGSGSHLEGEDDDDVMDENTDADSGEGGPSMTVPSQSTQPSNPTAATPGGSSRRSRHRGAASLTQHQQFLERMQHRQNQWFEQQWQLRQASDEAFMSQMISESNRSMGLVVTQFLTGLGALFQRPTPQPMYSNSHSQPMFQPYNNHFDNRQPPAPPHRFPYSHNNQPEHDHSEDQDSTPFCQL